MASDISNNSSVTDVGQLWKNAVLRYESIVKNRHDGSNVDKFRSLVYNSLVPIQKLGGIVAQATKATFPPSEAIFAAVRYLINVANTVSGGYDKVTSFFEDLDSYLNQLKVLEHNIPPLPELQKAITEVFASVLNLCGICAKYVKKKRIAIIMRNLITRDDSDLRAAYDTFHQMVRREQGVVRNAILAGVEELKRNNRVVGDEIKGNVALTQTIAKDAKTLLRHAVDTGRVTQGLETAQESDGILTWLSSLDFHEKQRAVFAKHQDGTGNWLLNTRQFQDWFSSKENSVLWCPGIAGAGKSVMMSMVVNHVDEQTESIVRQIAEQRKPMPQVVKIFRDKHAEKRRYPTTDERISLIESLCGLFKKTFIFVDALVLVSPFKNHFASPFAN
ncbi:hypothetical protein LY76DRAFT_310882 [Colletotrichum caudatum]|nr:hypothetical protein LY76DRAFT_310882 [Colletotrichum caudatum]